MSARRRERILCSLRNELPKSWLPRRGAVSISWDDFLAVMHARPPRLYVRGEIENNPSIKQWIPYVVLGRGDGCIACYPRQGSEARLHGNWSVGIGGHVNEGDLPPMERWDWREALLAGMQRELEEEAPGIRPVRPPRLLGLINEDETSVGSVHIGLVCEVRILDDAGLTAGEELRGLEWAPPARLTGGDRDRPLELWSDLALELLGKSASA